MKKLYILILALFAVWQVHAQVSLGSGTTARGYAPINLFYANSYTQQIFLSNDIGASGTISGLKFYLSASLSITNSDEWTVYLGHVGTQTDFASNEGWISTSNMTQVFYGTVTNTAGVVDVVFSTPFAYNGTDNLVVAVLDRKAGDNGNNKFYGSIGRANMTLYFYSDSRIPDPDNPPTTGNYVGRNDIYSNITFVGITQPCPVTFTGASASNVTVNSADVNFTPDVVAPNYEYYYSTSSAAPTAGTTISGATASTTVSLSGLTANTTYYCWVRAVCNSTDKSSWSSPFVFSTECSAMTTLPYVEDFETTSLPACWKTARAYGTGTSVWASGSSYYKTGARSVYLASQAAGTTVDLVALPVHLPSANTHQVRYSFRRASTSATLGEGLKLFVNSSPDTVGATELVNDRGTSFVSHAYAQSPVEAVAGWYEYSSPIPMSGDVYIIIRGYSKNVASMYIDDFHIETIPTCPKPSALSYSSISSSGVTVAWTGTAAGYDYYYATTSTAPTAATSPTGTSTTTNSVLTGLTPSTTYYFWVRSNCGGEQSDWSSVIFFKTPCAPTTTFPHFEGFETSSLPACWTTARASGTGSSVWASGSSYYHTGVRSIYLASQASGTAVDLVSLPITLPSANSHQVRFFFRRASTSTLQGEGLKLFVNSQPDTIGAVELVNNRGTNFVNHAYAQSPAESAAGWYEYYATIPMSGTVYIIVRGYSANVASMYIDDVYIEEIPACPKPAAITASAVTGTEATIAWTSTATSYEYYYSLSSTAPTATTTASGTTNTTSATITGLTSNTTYYYWVRAVCSASVTSEWSSALTFTTIQVPASIPYTEDFENATDWILLNGTQTNKWFIGSAATGTTGKSLYITNNSGVANAYSNTASTVWAMRPIDITEAASFVISFDWKAYGEGTTTAYDYLIAFLAPTGLTPTAGSQSVGGITLSYNSENPTGWQRIGGNYLSLSSSWQQVSDELALTPGTYQLIFLWINDNSTDNQPPAAIDNINIVKADCARPTNVTSIDITSSGASFSWDGTSDSYDYYLSTSSTPPTASSVPSGTGLTATSLNLTGLTSATSYYFWVRGHCGTDQSSWSRVSSFTTLCAPVTTFPLVQNFDASASLPICWSTAHTLGTSTSVFSTSTTYSHSSTRSAYIGSMAVGNNAILVTPQVVIPTANTHEVRFWMRRPAGTSAVGEVIKVWVNANPDTIGATLLTNSYGTTFINKYAGNIPVESANPSNDWYEYAATIPSAGTVHVVFEVVSQNGAATYLDDVTVREIPGCSAPQAPVIDQIQTTSAVVNITDLYGGTAWEIVYGAPGFDPNTATPQATTTLATTISGLSGSTVYQVYVRTDCGVNGKSAWSTPASFATLCTPITTLPHFEGFESTSLPICWTTTRIAGSGSYVWETSDAYAFAGSRSLYLRDQTSGTIADVVSPEFVIPTANTHQVRFVMRRTSSSATVGEGIRLFVNSTPDTIGAIALTNNRGTTFISNQYTQAPVESAGGWFEYSAEIPTSGNVYIIIRGYNKYLTSIYLDNVRVEAIPTCYEPFAVTVSSIGHNSARLNITDIHGGSAWEYVIGAPGFDPNTATPVATSSMSAIATGLTASTLYDVYVRTNCGTTDKSPWIGPYAFTTGCAPSTTLPFAESFESTTGSALPACWSTQHTAGTSTGVWASSSTYSKTGTRSAYMALQSAGNKTTLTLPALNIPTVNGYQLRFWMRRYNSTSYVGEGIKLWVNSTPDTIGGTPMLTNRGTSFIGGGYQHPPVETASDAAWFEYTAVIPTSGDVYITFETIWKNGYSIYLDDIVVEAAPPCIKPLSLSFDSIKATSARATIMDPYGSNWQFAVGAVGFTPDGSTVINTTSPVSTISGLAPDSAYHVYVRSDCGLDGTSAWHGPVSLTTPCHSIEISSSETGAVCEGTEVTLTAVSDGAYSYSWSDGSTVIGSTASIEVTPTTTTIYTMTGTLDNCTIQKSVTVMVNPIPGAVTITTNPSTATCGMIGLPISMSTTATSYNATVAVLSEDFNGAIPGWTLVNSTTGGSRPNAAAWLLKYDGYRYTGVGATTFHSNDNSQFIITNSDTVGSGASANTELISPVFAIPSAASNATLSFYHHFKPSGSGTVQISNDNGANWNDLIAYTVTTGTSAAFEEATVDLSAYIGVSNLQLRFHYVAGWQYFWAIDNVLVSASIAYAPTVTWSPAANLYTDAAGTTAYTAGTNASTVYAIFPAAASETYEATVAYPTGCSASADVTVGATLAPITVSPTATICPGSSTTLTASSTGNYSYVWNNGGGTGATVTVSPTATTTYTVTATDAVTGCAVTQTVVVNVRTVPAITIPQNYTVCAGSSTTLTATSSNTNYSYVWDNSVTNGVAFTPTATATYTVTATDNVTGCIKTGTVTVTVNPITTISVTSDVATICAGESAVLTASSSNTNYSYAWNNSAGTGASVTVSPTATTTYTVTATDNTTGCSTTGTVTITVNAAPAAFTIAAADSVKTNVVATMTASTTEDVTWSPIANLYTDAAGTVAYTAGTVANPVYVMSPSNQVVTFTATATNAAGCETTATKTITFDVRVNNDITVVANLKLYPNPVTTALWITSDVEITGISVYNVAGMKVKEQAGNSSTINLHELAPGSYVVSIDLKDGTTSQHKIIKK